jgi:hypothetical protein
MTNFYSFSKLLGLVGSILFLSNSAISQKINNIIFRDLPQESQLSTMPII